MFTFDLPDPDSGALIETGGPGEETEVTATPEVTEEITSELAAQQGALVAVMQAIAGVIQEQTNGQAGILSSIQSTMADAVNRQLAGQRAAAEAALTAIAGWVQLQLAQQAQNVNTTAIHAAMQPFSATALGPRDPNAPRPNQPPAPWQPARPSRPAPRPGPSGPSVPNLPPGPQMPPVPSRPQMPQSQQGTIPLAEQPSDPWRPQTPTGQQGTIPLVNQPPDPWRPAQQPTDPFTPTVTPDDEPESPYPLPDEPQPYTPPGLPYSATTPSGFPLPPQMAPFGPQIAGQPFAPGTTQPPPFMTSAGTQMGPAQGVSSTTGQNLQFAPESDERPDQPDVNLTFAPTINIAVDAKGGDSYATATATIIEADNRQINVSPEDDERDRRQINVQNENEERERLRRIFARLTAQPGDLAPDQPLPDCPWKLGMAIPKVGSPEWCAHAPRIAEGLALAGNTILNFVMQYTDGITELVRDRTRDAIRGGAWGGNTPIQRMMVAVIDPAVIGLKQLRAITDCWRQLGTLAPACDAKTLMGLAGLKMVVKVFRNLQIGLNFAIFTIAQLEIELEPLEHALDQLIRMMCPTYVPTPADAWTAYVAGYINEATWRCWTLCAGADPDLWRPALEAQGNALVADQVILWGRLTGEPPAAIDTALFQRGWTRDLDRAITQELYDHWSGGEEYIKWAKDGSLSPAMANRYQLEDGFADWWNGEPGQMARAHGWREDEARYNYRSMWVRPNALELQQFFWRMQPGASARGKGVTEDVIRGVLSLQGVLPWHQEAIVACLYRPLGMQEAALLIQVGLGQRRESHVAALDSGLLPAQAERVADATEIAAERVRALQEGGWSVGSWAAAQTIGYAPNVDAMTALGRQNITQEMVDQHRIINAVMARAQVRKEGTRKAHSMMMSATLSAYSVGLVTQINAARTMTAAGYTLPAAQMILQSRDLAIRAQRTARIIRALESAVLKGEMTPLAAAVTMGQMGLRQDSITQYMTMWQADSLAKRPHTSARDIRTLVAEGLLSPAGARLRLANLGWKDPDLTLQMMVANQRLGKARAMAQRKNASDVARAAREAEKVKQLALRRLEKSRPVSVLGQWFREGVLPEDNVKRRMKMYGYDDTTIDLYIASWTFQARKARQQNLMTGAAAPKPPERQVPLGTLKRWYVQGVVGKDYADGRLTSYGYDAGTRERYFAEWDASAADRQRRAEAKDEAGDTGGASG